MLNALLTLIVKQLFMLRYRKLVTLIFIKLLWKGKTKNIDFSAAFESNANMYTGNIKHCVKRKWVLCHRHLKLIRIFTSFVTINADSLSCCCHILLWKATQQLQLCNKYRLETHYLLVVFCHRVQIFDFDKRKQRNVSETFNEIWETIEKLLFLVYPSSLPQGSKVTLYFPGFFSALKCQATLKKIL